jgi:UDP-glucose 4-epimerase
MRILVTGGAGFIGSHVVDAYVQAGHSVAVLDNLYHGFRRNLNSRAAFYKVDLRQFAAVTRVIRHFRPDVINHHAAISQVVESMRAPLDTVAVNVTGSAHLLTAAGRAGIKKFIFASTGGTIYGNAQHIPTRETDPLEPVSMYALSKQLGEELIQYYARTYKFKYTLFRYGNVFGMRQDPRGEAGVIAIFAQLLNQGKAVTIFGNGSKTRDYVYIPDIVRANVLALRRGQNGIYNLGHGKPVRDDVIYRLVRQYFPTAKPPRHAPIRSGEIQYGAIKSTLAKHALGWQPRWTVQAGIADYLTQMHYV